MSCNCNNSYQNLPCCCPTGTTTTSTTTVCPDAIPCDEVVESDCVVYNGPKLECYGINSGDSVTDILEILIAHLPACVSCRSITLTPASGPVTFQYTVCGGSSVTTLTITTATTICCNINNSDFKITSGAVNIVVSNTSC